MGSAKKHPCKDCNFCLMCSETRCSGCRTRSSERKKTTAEEQIKIYESLNGNINASVPVFYSKNHKEEKI